MANGTFKLFSVGLLLTMMSLIAGCWAQATSVQDIPAEKPRPPSGQAGRWLLGDRLPPQAGPTVAYEYSAHESSRGRVIAEGILMLPPDFKDGQLFRGDWRIGGTDGRSSLIRSDPLIIGPQLGTGTVIGETTAGTVQMSFGGDVMSEVQLKGKVDGSRIIGTWMYWTYYGVYTNGAFEAIRKTSSTQSGSN